MIENTIKETVIRLAEPVVDSLGLVLWGVEIQCAGRMIVLLYVDTYPELRQTQGVDASPSIDQCEEISRHLGLALEVEDLIAAAYTLEVSTPGLMRAFFALEQLRPYLGDIMEVKLHMPITLGQHNDTDVACAHRRLWRGRLAAVQDDFFVLEPVTVTAEGDVYPETLPPVSLPWATVRSVNRMHIFRRPVKPGKARAENTPPLNYPAM